MATRKPNILMIMADQLTPMMLGCYGNRQVISPNIDALAARSRVYDCAYTPNPLCAPARAALMTGRYTSDTLSYDNTSALSCEEPTFCHALVNAGYDTVLSGKMHFVGPDQLHGFTHRLTTDIFPARFCWLPKFLDADKHVMQPDTWGNAYNYRAVTACPQEWNQGIQYDEETHVKAREYLYRRRKAGAEDPFFLCVSYHHPHDPFQPPRKYWDMYEGRDIDVPDIDDRPLTGDTKLDEWLNTGFHRTDAFPIKGRENLTAVRRAYMALVTYIDDKVGQLLEDLRLTGYDENTIVIFTSDHGDMLGERGMVQKRCFYEWSSRIPLLISMPGEGGARVTQPVSLLDLSATLIDMAGGDPLPGGDSYSLLGDVSTRPPVFCESHGEGILWPCYMVREGAYKYTVILDHERQLFNVEEDPYEQRNLAHLPENADLARHMESLIFARFDPQQVFHYINHVIPRKRIIQQAMQRDGTAWDFVPQVDESKRFSRT